MTTENNKPAINIPIGQGKAMAEIINNSLDPRALEIIDRHFTIVYAMSVKASNPNGDPDAENRPRCYGTDQIGYISPMCLKRRIRDYAWERLVGSLPGYNLGCQHQINRAHTLAQAAMIANPGTTAGADKTSSEVRRTFDVMFDNFWDIRVFGGVMPRFGAIVGPVQFGIAESVHPIAIESMTITGPRSETDDVGSEAIEGTRTRKPKGNDEKNLDDYEALEDRTPESRKRTMGRHHFVRFGLYRGIATVDPNYARKSKMTFLDMAIMLAALAKSGDNRTTTKGRISVPKIWVFSHKPGSLTSAPVDALENLITAELNDGVYNPTSIQDYRIEFDSDTFEKNRMFNHVSCIKLRDDMPIEEIIEEILPIHATV